VRAQFENWRSQRRGLNSTTNGNGHANGNGAGVIEEPIEDEEVSL
jgi:hypothetical protein